MNALKRLADGRPFLFSLIALAIWAGLAGLLSVTTAAILQIPMREPVPQRAGALGATIFLLLLAARLGWLGRIGITTFGRWTAWALTLLLAIYITVSGAWAFFGEAAFELGSLVDTREARAILANQAIVGFAEEILFRGLLLYALARVWGATRRGLLAAVLVQAVLFGGLHALALLGGSSPSMTALAVSYDFIVGVWLGALVLNIRSLWPAIFLHGAGNATMFVKALSTPWVDVTTAYPVAMLLELPLALIGLWVMLRTWHWASAPASHIHNLDLGSPAPSRQPG
jgi:membrane protease YdiL (CAAX protease family)